MGATTSTEIDNMQQSLRHQHMVRNSSSSNDTRVLQDSVDKAAKEARQQAEFLGNVPKHSLHRLAMVQVQSDDPIRTIQEVHGFHVYNPLHANVLQVDVLLIDKNHKNPIYLNHWILNYGSHYLPLFEVGSWVTRAYPDTTLKIRYNSLVAEVTALGLIQLSDQQSSLPQFPLWNRHVFCCLNDAQQLQISQPKENITTEIRVLIEQS